MPGTVPGLTLTIPVFGSNINPSGTVTGVKFTLPPGPGTAGVPPLIVSLPVTGKLGLPGVIVAVSLTALIVGATVITAVAVAHTIGVAVTVQIWYTKL